MRYGEVDGLVGVGDGVNSRTVFDPEQEFCGVAFVRAAELSLPGSGLQRRFFFDGLAILARRGSSDALGFRLRAIARLQNVGSTSKRAFRRPCAYQGMQLVNEMIGVLRSIKFS